jgi:hypothetical protein
MNTKTLAILGVVAAVLLGTALVVANKKGGAGAAASEEQGKKLFPELEKRVNDVNEVVVTSKDATFAVKKSGSTWGAADKGDYPVEFDKVRELVVGISRMEIVAVTTKNPEYHQKLGLEDVAAAESTSKRVTLKDSGGAALADLVIGKAKPHEGFGGTATLWVRKQGEDQTYEVTGQFNVAAELSNWLDREVAKIESARVKKTTVAHPDGATLTVSKAASTETNFSVEGLPEGAELQWPGVANGIPGALQYLNLDDVQPSASVDMSGAATAEFQCFDGLVITAKTIDKDGKIWMTLQASFDESLRAAPAAPPAADPAGDPASADIPPAEPAPTLKSIDDVKKEVEELNQKWSPWAFEVPGYNGANLRKKLPELLKQEEPAPVPFTDPNAPPAQGGTPPPEDHSGHDHGAHDGHDHGAKPTDPPPPPKDPQEPTQQPTGGG